MRSVRALVPDPRGLEQNFHDVTIVDMLICLNRRCRWTSYHFSATMAARSPPSHGVAAARPGYDAHGGQETVP